MADRNDFVQYRIFLRLTVIGSVLFLSTVLLGACGFSREEKQQMQEISKTAGANAVNYIAEKYGFTAEVIKADVCTERKEVFSSPSITGCAVVTMEYEGKKFSVHINGLTDTTQGKDDYEYDEILEEAKEYFASLLGYEIYDIYLEYKETISSSGQMNNLIHEPYQAGDFQSFMQQYPISISISDCLDQDFTDFARTNPEAAAYLEKCAEEYKTIAVLISYRDETAYQSGYVHTYGQWRIPDFEIEQDGMYIESYAVFEEGNTEYNRYELQEYDGMFFSCIDRKEDSELKISSGQREWLDLGETKKASVSAVYSADAEKTGEITVYIPYEKFSEDWRGRKVYVQHKYNGKWWQYDPILSRTKDGKYIFFTYYNFNGGGFDFAVFR